MLALYELWNDRHKWHPRLNERLWNNTLKKMVFSWDKRRRKRSRKWINKGLKKAKIKIQWYYNLMKVKREWSVGTWSCHLGGIIVVVGNIGIWKKSSVFAVLSCTNHVSSSVISIHMFGLSMELYWHFFRCWWKEKW